MLDNIRDLWGKLISPQVTGEARQQAALFRLSAELAAALTEDEVCRRVVDGMHDTLGYDFVVIFLVDEITGDRVMKACIGFENPPPRLQPGQGLSERPLQDGQLQYTPVVNQRPNYFYGMGGSEVDVPIRIGGEVSGVLIAESKQRNAFNQDDFEVLTAAAQQAGLAIEKVRLLAAERQRADELDALHNTMTDITAELELQTLLKDIVERAAGLLNASGGELGLYDETRQEIRIVVSQNLGDDYVGTRHPIGEGAMSRVAETGEPLIIDDYQGWKGHLPQYSHVHATLAVPLKVGGRLVGVFTTVTTDPNQQFTHADLHLLNLFGQQAAIAINNARLYEQAQREIAEREKFEGEIRRQKEYFESLFVNNPVAVVTADLDGNIVSWNPMAENLFGYSKGEVIGRNLDDVVAKDDSIRTEAVSYTNQVIKKGRVQTTTRRTRKDGSMVDVELLALPVILAEDKVGFIAIYHDITERKRIERELRRQKEYFEALFVNNPVAVVTINKDGNAISWNPMAERLFGYGQEEVIGKNIDGLVASHPLIHEEALNFTRQVSTTGRVQAITKRNRKDGSLVDVEVLALPVIVGEEKVGYIGIYFDITDLQEARREAEAANQAKSVFLANMSHELRTPLNAILGFTQLMDRDPNLNAVQRENLETINRSGEHLLTLINDVLDMSKIEAGKVTLQENSFDLYLLLDNLVDMFRVRSEEKGLIMRFFQADNVPQYVVADESRLRQVLMNLLGNAVKFTQTGDITLRVNASSPGNPNAREKVKLHFEVEDTGPGIASDELAIIFEPFVQTTRGQQHREGTGLGLSISRQFVQLMGGELTASSEVGHGSVFKVDVNVELAEVSVVQALQPKQRPLRLEPGQPIFRLLIVEDRESNRRLLVRLMEAVGFEVQEAVNGQQAIKMWEHKQPNLIWMDMQMPVMDGYEATRRIKATPQGRATPIIALTATAFEADRELALAAGCDDFVSKPFDQDEIFAMLARHLGVRYVYEEEPYQPPTVEPAEADFAYNEVLNSENLAAMPASWLAELKNETIKADLSRILQLIDQTREQNPSLAEGLTELAINFEHKRILTLIDQAGG